MRAWYSAFPWSLSRERHFTSGIVFWAKMYAVWLFIRLLTDKQAFVLALITSTILTLPIAFWPEPHYRLELLRDFIWPYQTLPYIRLSLLVVALLPALLGYYRGKFFGFFLGAACGAFAYLLSVFAMWP